MSKKGGIRDFPLSFWPSCVMAPGPRIHPTHLVRKMGIIFLEREPILDQIDFRPGPCCFPQVCTSLCIAASSSFHSFFWVATCCRFPPGAVKEFPGQGAREAQPPATRQRSRGADVRAAAGVFLWTKSIPWAEVQA